MSEYVNQVARAIVASTGAPNACVNQVARALAVSTGHPNARVNQVMLAIIGSLTPAPLPWIPPGGARANSVDPVTGALVGNDPQIVLQTSNDGGRTWGSERSESLGKIGDFQKLLRWRRNGRSNNRAFRVICSEAVDVSLIAADLDT